MYQAFRSALQSTIEILGGFRYDVNDTPWSESMNELNIRRHFLAAAICGGLIGCQPQQPAERPAVPAESNEQRVTSTSPAEAKVTTLPVDFAGFEEQLKKLEGKLVVVDVWSTGCPPCMKEYPNLVALSTRWPEQVACVSYNVDYIGQKSKPVESYLPKVGGFLEKVKSTGVINLVSSEADSDVFEKLEIASIPVVILYDKQGKLLKKFTEANSGEDGLTYESDIIPAIEAALK
jgi:thiol-disulfide isomerase/thioredoxin